MQIENLKKFIDNTVILNNVTFNIEKGEFLSLMGPSGAGKTTLLYILAGLDVADSGVLRFDNDDLMKKNDRELSKYRCKSVGFIFQNFNLIPSLTVEENIKMATVISGKKKLSSCNKIEKMMDKLEILKHKNKYPYQLSGGQQQRVAIVRAMANDPIIIFADEPTGNLDSKNSLEVMKLLKDINQYEKKTIVQVTHSKENSLFGDRVIRFVDGQVRL